MIVTLAVLLACAPAGSAHAAKVKTLLTGGVVTAEGHATGGEDALHDVTAGGNHVTQRIVDNGDVTWNLEWLYNAGYPHTLAGPTRLPASIDGRPNIVELKAGGTETRDETDCNSSGCKTQPTQHCDFNFATEPQATTDAKPPGVFISPLDELRRDNCFGAYSGGYTGGMPWTLATAAKLALVLPGKPARKDELKRFGLIDIKNTTCPDDWKHGASDVGYCNVSGQGETRLELICAACVQRMTFKQAAKPGGRLAAVPSSGAHEGTPVHVYIRVKNIWDENLAVAPVMRDGSGHGRDLKGTYPKGGGYSLPHNHGMWIHFVWKTDGLGRKGGPPRRVQFLTQFGGGEVPLRILPPRDEKG
jgi:hypothetical protein